MPLHSYTFILLFLPVTLAGFHLLRARVPRVALAFLTLASLLFYATWDTRYVALIAPLMAIDLFLAHGLRAYRDVRPGAARALLLVGIGANLAALTYCKYAGFFVETMILPIAISFLTFQKIAFLVDVYRGDVTDLDWLRYAAFVLFFPKLLSGPIVYHRDIVPQLARLDAPTRHQALMAVTLFTFGLAKKVLLADRAAAYASPLFDAAAQGASLDLVAAWAAVLAYGAEIYFDFSGYSDMAIGAALLFGIRLPINFDAPYRATDLADFWRRWHISLSRFLREYVFLPLAFSLQRLGRAAVPCSLFITMVVCGLWHGAQWTFIAWGALHGAYLVAHHALGRRKPPVMPVVTFVAVMAAWTFFGSVDIGTAAAILAGMAGVNGIQPAIVGFEGGTALVAAAMMLVLAVFGPTSQHIVGYSGPDADVATEAPAWVSWSPSPAWAVCMGGLFALCLMRLTHITQFIYFRF